MLDCSLGLSDCRSLRRFGFACFAFGAIALPGELRQSGLDEPVDLGLILGQYSRIHFCIQPVSDPWRRSDALQCPQTFVRHMPQGRDA